MKTGTVKRETTNQWTEASMLKKIKEGIPSFGGGIGSIEGKVKITIMVENIIK